MQKTGKTNSKGRRRLIIAVTVLLCLAVLYAVQWFYRSDPDDLKRYKTTNPEIHSTASISAHRSGAGVEPEETLMAFRHCLDSKEFNADCFEFDLHITKDNVLVLLHDDTLDRTSDSKDVFGEKRVRPEDKTLSELKQLNMGAKFKAEDGSMPYADLTGDEVTDDLRILTLDEALDFLESHGQFRYIIEIKNKGDLGKKGLDILYDSLEKRDMVDRVIFGTFQSEVAKYADERYPALARGACPSEVLKFVGAMLVDSDNFDPDYEVLQLPNREPTGLGINIATVKTVNYAHAHNLAVQYWTVNDEKEAQYLNSIGADCLMSDYPEMAYRMIRKK
jgi:glycerophosphoryl diester phosphodiesterase